MTTITTHNPVIATRTVDVQQHTSSTQNVILVDSKAKIAKYATSAFAALSAVSVFLFAKVQTGLNVFYAAANYFATVAHTINPALNGVQVYSIGGACSGISMVATAALAAYSGAKLGAYAYNRYTSI